MLHAICRSSKRFARTLLAVFAGLAIPFIFGTAATQPRLPQAPVQDVTGRAGTVAIGATDLSGIGSSATRSAGMAAIGGTAIGGGQVRGANAAIDGGTAAMALSAWAGDTISIMAFTGADPSGATTSDTAFTSAINTALARPHGAKIKLPAGNFVLTSSQTISMLATNSIFFEGDGPGVTTITQSGPADAFDVRVANYITKNGQFIGFKGITFSYKNSVIGYDAVKITTSALSGQQGEPLYIEGCSFIGAWSDGINITALPTQTYISNSTFFLSSNSTGISFQGDISSGTYSVALMLDNIVSWGGSRFLYVGPYVQGVIARGLNIAASRQSVFWDARSGIGEQFILEGSYLEGGVYIETSADGTLTGVQISNNYFDGQTESTNELNIVGVLAPVVNGNFFLGNGAVGGVALRLSSGTQYGVVANNVFTGFMGGSGNGAAITMDAGTSNNLATGNNILNTTAPTVDRGNSNLWANNKLNGYTTVVGRSVATGIDLSTFSSMTTGLTLAYNQSIRSLDSSASANRMMYGDAIGNTRLGAKSGASVIVDVPFMPNSDNVVQLGGPGNRFSAIDGVLGNFADVSVRGRLALGHAETAVTSNDIVAVAGNVTRQQLQGAGALATLTIRMPKGSYDGQILEVFCDIGLSVTSLTVTSSSGQTVLNPPTSLSSGGGFNAVYIASSAKWVFGLLH